MKTLFPKPVRRSAFAPCDQNRTKSDCSRVVPLGSIVATVILVTRSGRGLGQAGPVTVLPRTSTPDSDSETAARYIPPPQSLKQAEKEVALALQQLLNDTQTNSNVESLDQTEQLAQELQQLLNEAQTKQRAKAPRPDRATCWGIEHPARPSKPASRTTPRSACLGGRTVTK